MRARRALDLTVRAENGLRRGRTTGTCATAAVSAALHFLLQGEAPDAVDVMLPDDEWYLRVPVERVVACADGAARANVLKDGGDDPDNTHGAIIFAVVRRNALGELRFLAGPGVGMVTQPGLRVPVGEPAINPVPRQMMRAAVAECVAAAGRAGDRGWDLEIGCEDGEAIARKTFNPRLGIVGGISILGTSGIVEPMSLAAYMASIEVYVRVALGDRPGAVAYTPGKIGRWFAADVLHFPPKRVVQIANFVGVALDTTEATLREQGGRLDTLWVLGHPGKLAKLLDGVWDTHSRQSGMAMPAVARVAAERGVGAALVAELAAANTVEAAVERLQSEPEARDVWREVEARVAARIRPRVPSVARVEVRLFAMDGTAIGEAAGAAATAGGGGW